MVRIAVLGVAGVLLALQLKALKPEYALYLCLGTSLLIFLEAGDALSMMVDSLSELRDSLPLDTAYLRMLLKIVGITYVAEFAADLCKDAGYQTIAGQIRIFGKLSVLSVSVPVMTGLLRSIQSFLGG